MREKCPYLELFWCAFSRIRTEYFVSLRIQSKCGKMQTRITPNINTSHTVTFTVSILAKWWYTLSALIPCAVLLTILLIIWVARINRYIFVVHVDRKTTYYMYMCDWWETRTLGWCVKIVQTDNNDYLFSSISSIYMENTVTLNDKLTHFTDKISSVKEIKNLN